VTGASANARWGKVLGRLVAYQERKRLRQARFFSATSGTTDVRLRAIVGEGAIIHRIGAGVPDELFNLPHRDAGYLLYFGRLDWIQKGLDTLLGAMAILVRVRPDLNLKIAGRGRDVGRVRDLAQALGIERNVEYLGAVTEPEREALFAGASMLLMPSRFEGFGMVAAEAMAAGVPVVASNADSLPEVVDPPAGGVLVDPGDAAGLAEAASRLLDHAAERDQISRTARASAERFRWERVADQHLDFIEAIRRGG
jgi:glycosyltransferase involved in cell wall biosynthesis